MKHNIVRYFVETHDVTLVVVPFDYDLAANPRVAGVPCHARRRRRASRRVYATRRANLKWDGLFCSNGPGDPSQCKETIKSLKWAISQDVPIFGICLGNQLLALAAGAKTYKMKYGNRGMNQPCVVLTRREK